MTGGGDWPYGYDDEGGGDKPLPASFDVDEALTHIRAAVERLKQAVRYLTGEETPS